MLDGTTIRLALRALAVDGAGWKVGAGTLNVDLTYDVTLTGGDAAVYVYVNGVQAAVRNYTTSVVW